MIPERDTDVHTSTPSTLQATEPVFYLAKIRQAAIFVGAARMATRYIKKTREVQLRVIRCEPPVVIQDMASGRSEVTEATLLVELNRDDSAAIIEWAKILGAATIELEKVTAAQAEQQLNSIASLATEPGLPGSPTNEHAAQVSYWNPLVEFPSTVTVPTDSGLYTYFIKGDLYPRDLWHAIRHVTKGVAVAIGHEIDCAVKGVARGATVVLSHKKQDDTAMCRIGELISEGAVTVTRLSHDFTFTDVYPPLSEKKQKSRTEGQAEPASNLLLSSGGQIESTGKSSKGTGGQDATPARSKQPIPRVSATAIPDHFLGDVPDFISVDWHLVRPNLRERDQQGHLRRGRHHTHQGLWGLLHRLVIQQGATTIIVPELLAAQTLWGRDKNDWPANWRGKLEDRLGKVNLPSPAAASIDDGPARQVHFCYRIKTLDDCPPDRTFLGALESFAFRDANGQRLYDFSEAAQSKRLKLDQERIDRDRKSGRITSVYLPLLVFGPARRMNLPYQQRHLLLAITHELTRTSRTSRDDRAKIIVGGKKIHGVYPGLQAGVSYVAFNGNAPHARRRLRGYGYRLIGRTGKGWLYKAGYSVPEDARGRWLAVSRFLKDLDALAARFGLVVAAWHQGKAEWKPLADLRAMVRHLAGRRWLNQCVLRIYTAADYLARWRRHFAEQMGFTFIPGGEDAEPIAVVHPSATPAIRSALDLDKWMNAVGMTNKELAEKLKISERWVRHQRHGTRPWSRKFEKDMELVVRQASLASK